MTFRRHRIEGISILAEDETGGVEQAEPPLRYTIQVDGESGPALRLAEACVNESKGDILLALVNLAERALVVQSIMSTGISRGTVSVWPDENQNG